MRGYWRHWGSWRGCDQLLEGHTVCQLCWMTVPHWWGWSNRVRRIPGKEKVINTAVIPSMTIATVICVVSAAPVIQHTVTIGRWHSSERAPSHAEYMHAQQENNRQSRGELRFTAQRKILFTPHRVGSTV